jgi:hypothetical protein
VTSLGIAVGCEKNAVKTYFVDSDKDGVGDASKGVRPSCTEVEGWATADGDCDENRKEIHPGAIEACNARDDDCDGMIDEGVRDQPAYPDRDGDGYGDPTGMPISDCTRAGYAANRGDCDDKDPQVHPGASEVCNGLDEDCDRAVDERVKPTCGVGSCARWSATCDVRDCTPGSPADERCDTLDNDCDGALDEALRCDLAGSGASMGVDSGLGGAGAPVQSPVPAAATGAGGAAQGALPGATAHSPAPATGCRAARGATPGWVQWLGALVVLGGLRRCNRAVRRQVALGTRRR